MKTWRRFDIYDNISLNYFRMRNVSSRICKENKNTHFISNNFFFFENRVVYETVSKNVLEPDRSQMEIWLRVECWISKATCARPCTLPRPRARTHSYIHTHTEICNTYCYSTATMVSWTRLIVALHVHCLSLILQQRAPVSLRGRKTLYCVMDRSVFPVRQGLNSYIIYRNPRFSK